MILLDTHVILWLALEPARISRRAKSAIDEARKRGEGLAIADITLLEIATLVSKGRIALGSTLETFLTEVEARFVTLPITARSSSRAVGLPAGFPSDPADRIICATALVEGIPLITADDAIRRSKVIATVW